MRWKRFFFNKTFFSHALHGTILRAKLRLVWRFYSRAFRLIYFRQRKNLNRRPIGQMWNVTLRESYLQSSIHEMHAIHIINLLFTWKVMKVLELSNGLSWADLYPYWTALPTDAELFNHLLHYRRSLHLRLPPLLRWSWRDIPDRSPCKYHTWKTVCRSRYRVNSEPQNRVWLWLFAGVSNAWWRLAYEANYKHSG